MERLFRLLDGITARPELYVGSRDLRLIYAFVSGYLLAAAERGERQYEYMHGFQEFIARRFSEERSLNWCDILIERCGEAAAAERFIGCWKEYRSLQGA